MSFEMRNGQMFIFTNERKEKDNQPDRTGTLKINDVEYRVSGWLKEGKNGTFLSCQVQKKDEFGDKNNWKQSKKTKKTKTDPKEDIPF